MRGWRHPKQVSSLQDEAEQSGSANPRTKWVSLLRRQDRTPTILKILEVSKTK